MEFKNAGIALDQLPRAEEIQWQPIDPRYRKVLWRQWLITWALVLIAAALLVFFSTSLQDIKWISLIAGGLVLLALLNWVVVARSFTFKAYALREHDIFYRTGWLLQSVRVCPFNRIQHCSVDAGILERKYGLSSLSVFTAGGNEADMKIPGLPEPIATSLREWIIQKTGGHEQSL
ncbi:MAG TPA: PH domain-containing protein [Chitinophagaceae bacterium]|nr:PH domain-containing protein [Chitinophagaceae bacterium]